MPAIRTSAIRPIAARTIGRRRGTNRRLAATKRLAFGTALAGLALLVLATQVSGQVAGQPVTTGGVGPQTGPTYPEIAQLPGGSGVPGDASMSDGLMVGGGSIETAGPLTGRTDDLRNDTFAPLPRRAREPAVPR